MANQAPTVADLIDDGERYLAGEPLYPIAWVDAVLDVLAPAAFAQEVVAELRDWMQTPEPRLDDALIRRGLEKLRMVA